MITFRNLIFYLTYDEPMPNRWNKALMMMMMGYSASEMGAINVSCKYDALFSV